MGMSDISGLEGDEAESAHILLIVMFLLETHDTFALFKHYVIPVTHSAIGFHLSNRIIMLIAEPHFVHPVFACLDSNFAHRSVCWQIDT